MQIRDIRFAVSSRNVNFLEFSCFLMPTKRANFSQTSLCETKKAQNWQIRKIKVKVCSCIDEPDENS